MSPAVSHCGQGDHFAARTLYRPLRKADHPAVEQLIADSFHLEQYLPDPVVLAQVKHAYLQSCLAEQTFCQVAEQDGVVVGIIMCSAKNHYRFLPHLKPLCTGFWYIQRVKRLARKRGCPVDAFFQIHQIYGALLEEQERRYDGVLTLFAVAEDCRGTGIGRTLLGMAERYLRENGVHRIYLYTDSGCNTAFYDHHGFTCAGQQMMLTDRDEQCLTLMVFLYEKQY